MFTDGKMWYQTINYNLLACYRWKQNWKITSVTDFMAFLVKALFWWNECSKIADISILSNFLAIFSKCFSWYREILPRTIYMPNFKSIGPSKQKLQILPPPHQSAKSPACLGLRKKIPIKSKFSTSKQGKTYLNATSSKLSSPQAVPDEKVFLVSYLSP